MATMKLEVITAERSVLTDDVDVVVAPGIDGELGILPHHAPLMTFLAPGELTIRKGGQETYLAVNGGYLEVLGNKVTVLADTAERSDEIDLERARKAMARAQEAMANKGEAIQLEAALHALRRANVRIRVAERRRGSGPVRPPSGT